MVAEEGVAEDGDRVLGDDILLHDALLALGDTARRDTQALDGIASCDRLVLDSEVWNSAPVSHDILGSYDIQALDNGALAHRGGQILVCSANPRA